MLNKNNKLSVISDSNFVYYFNKSKLNSFVSLDSTIKFDFLKSKLSLGRPNNRVYTVEFNNKQKSICDSIITLSSDYNYFIDTTKLFFEKYTIVIYIMKSNRRINYELQIEWDDKDLFLTTKYKNNNFESIIIRDNKIEIGYSMAGSFKTGKYIWDISPFYRSEKIDPITNEIAIYNKLIPYKFYYEFNYRGRLKSKKSFGRIIYN